MNKMLSAALLAVAILSFGGSCQKETPVDGAVERIRAFAESKNPQLKDQPLEVTVSRKNGDRDVCACMQVCSAGGRCTGCSCSPANCGSCASAAELAPIDSVFESKAIEKK